MRILLLETDRHAGDVTSRRLAAAGHDVRRCHERGLPAFPCAALSGDAACPLDADVDVAVTVRSHPYPRPVALEDGVLCALRRHIPLVVAGRTALNPFVPWTEAIATDADIVAVCEQVVRGPLPGHTEAARRELERCLDRRGLATGGGGGGEVTVHRDTRERTRLRITFSLPAGMRAGDAADVAPRLLGAVRAFDRDAAVIDITCTN